jgi:IS1 family transposase
MNKLDSATRVQIVSCLVEGNSIRATCRMTGAAKNTVVKLLADLGRACSEYQDKTMVNLHCNLIQCDEIWSFVGCKPKNLKEGEQGRADVWTWTAIDSQTKLVPCWYIGSRDAGSAYHFMHHLAARLAHRVQLTAGAHRPYLSEVENAFGSQIDYAQLIKIYGKAPEGSEVRYSPAQCVGERKAVVTVSPDKKQVSASLVDRRFTRLTNAFSKKIENLEHAVALHFINYNFCRIHQTLRVTPAMEAGIADHVWSLDEVVALLK